jgi:hypothetical protein
MKEQWAVAVDIMCVPASMKLASTNLDSGNYVFAFLLVALCVWTSYRLAGLIIK